MTRYPHHHAFLRAALVCFAIFPIYAARAEFDGGIAAGCACNADLVPPAGMQFSDVSHVVDCLRLAITDPACDINCDGIQDTKDLADSVCAFRGGTNCCSLPYAGCCRSSASAPLPQCQYVHFTMDCAGSDELLGFDFVCAARTCDDCDNNDMPDGKQIVDCVTNAPSCADCDSNEILDICEGTDGTTDPFSSFGTVPEVILPSQGGYPSGYFVPDADDNLVYRIPPSGEPEETFSSGSFNQPIGATFVPGEFGGSGTRLFVANGNSNAVPTAPDVVVVDSSGAASSFSDDGNAGGMSGLVYLPQAVGGPNAGKLLGFSQRNEAGTELTGSVYSYDAAGNRTTLISSAGATLFTPVLIPSGFGTIANSVLCADARGPTIFRFDPQTNALSEFATVLLLPGQVGLRQMAFSPVGWFAPFDPAYASEPVLVLSVSGSMSGGGSNGAIVVLNSSGATIGRFSQEQLGLVFDPRGLVFVNGQLYIANSASGNQGIVTLTIDDFLPADCDNNDIPDLCDIRDCPPTDLSCRDCNGNEVPDSCEGSCVADVNGDNLVNLDDAMEVADCIKGVSSNPACDINCDGIVSTHDHADALCRIRGGGPDCCDQPYSACCVSGTLADIVPCWYVHAGVDCMGTYLGPNSLCSLGPCDCNSNGIPDVCDTVCIGPCARPGCGLSNDCDGDLVPDECQFPDPSTVGACCFLDDQGEPDCLTESSSACAAISGGVWAGACTRCSRQNTSAFGERGGTIFVHAVFPPTDCAALLPRGTTAGCSTPYTDAWVSPADPVMCHSFGVQTSPAIPADFFGSGSDPFVGQVCLEGVPLGDPRFPGADTLIERSADPFGPCDLPGPSASDVTIRVRSLSLQSTAPVTITYNGGQSAETWDAFVDLSTRVPPPGGLTARKTHCNGGTFTSILPVLPRFTFRKVVDPQVSVVLDTGVAGQAPVVLQQNDPIPWVASLDPTTPILTDGCSSFHPAVDDAYRVVECDCNGNMQTDACDLASGTAQDCNFNESVDTCDIAVGISTDFDGNAVPDECQPPPAPLSEIPSVSKTRFISFGVPASSTPGAIRIELTSLHHVDPPYTGGPSVPFTSLEGQVRWAGPPQQYEESTSNQTPFFASNMQCTPHYQDWSTVPILHLTGSAIVPSSIYKVVHVAGLCMGNEATCTAVSAPLAVITTRWGDVETPYNPPSITAQPDVGDIAALVAKFRSLPTGPIKARALLAGDDSFGNINSLDVDFGFTHIAACVDAFRGKPYPHTISVCP